jgi:putative ABC transport system ATP-binding protein
MTTASAEPPVIRLAGLSYTYPGPPPVPALRAMDLVVRRGEHVAITGPSGSGKSTLLNLVGLLDRPTAGTIEIDGQDVGGSPERRRAAVRALRIGFVFQSFHLLPHRTALENVMLAQVYTGLARRGRRAAALDALAQVGLCERTGGERQRVAIARALLNRPSLLLCDEPTGNLDSATTAEISSVLEGLHRDGTTLLVITHNPAVAQRAQRRITIRDGYLTEPPGPQAAAPDGARHVQG